MKLTLLLIVASLMQVSASTFAQRITLSKQNASLIAIFNEIQAQSDVDFVYSNRLIAKANKISIDVKNAPLLTVLDYCFKNQPFSYSLENKSIVIKEKSILDKAADLFSLPAKERVVTGQVTDKKGSPLANVNITVKGKTYRTFTNSNGNYQLSLPSEGTYTLVFSFVGKKTQSIEVKGKLLINVQMEEDSELETVEVTGYQRIDKKQSTSAVSSVKALDVLVPGMTSIDQALEGRIPELVLMTNSGEVGSTPRIRVRGTSTLLGNREPLWVLDGFIMHDPVNVSNDDLNNPDYINIVGNAIAGINPQDIERIDILKDASATALYGTRAANGVIVVTTKKGAVGPARFSYNHSSKLTRRPRYSDRNINLMNSQERVKFGKDLSDLHYQFPSNMPLVGYEGAIHRYYKGINTYDQFLNEVSWYETVNTDWFDILTRDGYSQDHTLGVSGGSNSMRYYASLGYNPEKGVTKGTSTDRYTTRVNLDFTFSEKFKANISLNGNIQKKSHLITDINAMDYAYNTTRTLPFQNADGTPFYYDYVGYSGLNRPANKFRYNIMNEIDNSSNTYDGNTLGTSMTLRYNFLKELELSVAGNYQSSSALQEQWWGEQSHYIARLKNGEYEAPPKPGELGYSILPYGGLLKTSNSRNEGYTLRSQLDYRKLFGVNHQHLISAMGGFELNGSTNRSISDENRGFVKERGLQFIDQIDLDIFPLYKSWLNNNHRTIRHDINRQVSGYFTLSYSFKNHFTINGNTRIDASNKFGSRSNERMLPVWSVSGMWNAKDVVFKDLDFISDARIKTSYGIQGNMLDDQSPNLIIKQGTIDPTYNENTSSIARYPNPNLLWEKTKQFNLGVDLSFFDNRLNLSGTFYVKKTEDAFTNVKVSSINGVAGHSYVMNNGDLENNGYSVSLSARPVKGRNFQWFVSTYFSGNFNKINSSTVDTYTLADYLNGTALVADAAVSSFYSYQFLGLNPLNGTPVFNDYSDRRHLLEKKSLEEIVMMTMENSGQREPVFTGNFANTFTYKSLSLSVNMAYSLGSKVRLFSLYEPIISGVSAGMNVRKEFTQRWMAPGDENFTNIPAIMSPSDPEYLNYMPHFSANSSTANAFPRFASSVWDMYDKSDLRVVSGNYLKCSSLSMRYTLDAKLLKKTPFSAASFSLNSLNLFTIAAKELEGQDPTQAGFAKPNLSIRPSYTLQFNVTF